MGSVYDVIIAGLGAIGSSAAWHLAGRGLRVLGLDRYAPPHEKGSSHGRTRIIREAYFEHPLYVPLVRRAYQRWAELERECGRRLFRQTGGLMVGPPQGIVFAGARRSARAHSLPHEELTAQEVRRRFPGLRPADGMMALLEPRAGVLFAEACMQALWDRARARGAFLSENEPLTAWDSNEQVVRVATPRGRYEASHLLLCAGPWLPRLLEPLALALEVERQLSHWFEPAESPEAFTAERCPVTVWEPAPGRVFYTTPDAGGHGLKAGIHHEGEATDPDHVRRDPTPEDELRVRVLLERFLPAANGRLREARVCLYTNTPDRHFLIDRHPDHPRVVVASPCSGHGFKFASAIGEVLADLVTEGRSAFDLSPFGLERLRPRTS